ncbi:MAG: hypothetical protein N2254_09745 [bacterium]|nr:hypothetical protein [bacterium]
MSNIEIKEIELPPEPVDDMLVEMDKWINENFQVPNPNIDEEVRKYLIYVDFLIKYFMKEAVRHPEKKLPLLREIEKILLNKINFLKKIKVTLPEKGNTDKIIEDFRKEVLLSDEG